AHSPQRVPSPRKHTPHTECPELGHLPRLRRLSRRRRASPDQSVEYVVGVTVLTAGHPNRRRRSGRRSSPPKQHQADVLRQQARLDPIEVRLKPIEPTHSAPPEHHRPPPFPAIRRRRRILPLRCSSRLESTRRRRRWSFAAVGQQPPSPPLLGPRCLRFFA
ncbi:Os06g0279950, partial [Oryza sativa Japonica Group]